MFPFLYIELFSWKTTSQDHLEVFLPISNLLVINENYSNSNFKFSNINLSVLINFCYATFIIMHFKANTKVYQGNSLLKNIKINLVI